MRLKDKMKVNDPSTSKAQSDIRTAAVSHIGASHRRTLLEDRSRSDTFLTARGIQMALGIVADGIGGENAGERAAEVTVNAIYEFCVNSEHVDIPQMLEEALKVANERVFADARRSRRKKNMGSTAAVAAIVDQKLYIGNVGDSQIFLIRGRNAHRLTIDHTWENEIKRSGKLSPEEIAKHPRKDEIVRSIGYDALLNVDLGVWLEGGQETEAKARAAQGMSLQPGDRVLVCSDGLTKTRHDNPLANYVEEKELPGLAFKGSPKQAANALVSRALSRNVDDNVSAVILEVSGGRRPMGVLKPAIAAAGAIVVLGAGIWIVPKILSSRSGQTLRPTIPPLPSGVAYISEIEGGVERLNASGNVWVLQKEELLVAEEGLRIQVFGGDSYVRMGLADQSIVFLGPNTEIELPIIADGIDRLETVIILHRGVLLVAGGEGGVTTVAVRTSQGAVARIIGSLMGVIYDSTGGRFDVDCFLGLCELEHVVYGEVRSHLLEGQHTWMNAIGDVSQTNNTRNERYAFGAYCGGLVLTPTPIPSPTPTITNTPTRTPRPYIPPKPTKTSEPRQLPPPPQPTATDSFTATPISSDTPLNTNTPSASDTPLLPTDTQPATNTPESPPTNTSEPPPTNTPIPPPTNTPEPPPTETSES